MCVSPLPHCTCLSGTSAVHAVDACSVNRVCITFIKCRTSVSREGKASAKEQDKLLESHGDSVTADGLQDNKKQRPQNSCRNGCVCVCDHSSGLAVYMLHAIHIPQFVFITADPWCPSPSDTNTLCIHLHVGIEYNIPKMNGHKTPVDDVMRK